MNLVIILQYVLELSGIKGEGEIMEKNPKKRNYKDFIIRGGACGVITSLIITFWIIVVLYFQIKGLLCLFMVLSTAFISWLLISSQDIRAFIITWIISIGCFVITHLLIDISNIIDIIFKQIHGLDVKMWAGDGFGILVVHMFNYFGSLVGIIAAFITTLIKKNKNSISE